VFPPPFSPTIALRCLRFPLSCLDVLRETVSACFPFCMARLRHISGHRPPQQLLVQTDPSCPYTYVWGFSAAMMCSSLSLKMERVACAVARLLFFISSSRAPISLYPNNYGLVANHCTRRRFVWRVGRFWPVTGGLSNLLFLRGSSFCCSMPRPVRLLSSSPYCCKSHQQVDNSSAALRAGAPCFFCRQQLKACF